MKRTKSWLALLLLLQVVVHPLLHVAAPQAMASEPDTLSATVGGHPSQSHDCELCRISNSIAPSVESAAPAVFDSSAPVVIDPNSATFELLHSELAARAPPTC